MVDDKGRIERKLAAILAADVAGYSRLMSTDEAGTLRKLAAYRRLMGELIAQHGGRIANTAGDSVLAEFPNIVDAVECSIAVQLKLGETRSVHTYAVRPAVRAVRRQAAGPECGRGRTVNPPHHSIT
jgi:class 3 adenylate cyclase